MKVLSMIISLVSTLVFINNLQSQCIPTSSDSCDIASVFCSLEELNGYCCKNIEYSNPTGCSPLCPSGGSAHNTGWWAFVTNGGNVTIDLMFYNCSVNGTGVQMGIWGDCNCTESIICNPACNGPGAYTISGFMLACKTYYLFIDGCSGDVCDFCIYTSGGNAPKLPDLGSIQGPKNVCTGSCGIRYYVELVGSCKTSYEWTLDGVMISSFDGEISMDFPGEGNYVLCVTSYIGNPRSGSICDQKGPICQTISVKSNNKIIESNQYIPKEAIPYTWNGILITESTTHKRSYLHKENCCSYDSLYHFIVYSSKNFDVIITPNGDNFNDDFRIDFAPGETLVFQVFDKWGTRVLLNNNFNISWEGIGNSGEPLPGGVYSYLLTNKQEKIIQKGTITIIY